MSNERKVIAGLFDPDKMTSGFGGPDNVVVEVTAAKWVINDFNGKGEFGAKTGLELTYMGDDEYRPEFYSIGKDSTWQPSDDGTQVFRTDGGESSFPRNSGLGAFVATWFDAGATVDQLAALEDDVTALVGCKMKLIQRPLVNNDGTPKTDKNGYQKRVTECIEFHGGGGIAETISGAPAAAAKGKGKTTTAKAEAAPAPSGAAATLTEWVNEAGGIAEMKPLRARATALEPADRRAMLLLLADAAKGSVAGLTYDKGSDSLMVG